jgi:hypothetical protein
MARRDRLVLRAFSLWSFFVWGVLIRNMLKDQEHGVGFRAVHITLAVISITFAIATWRISSRAGSGRSAEVKQGVSAGL